MANKRNRDTTPNTDYLLGVFNLVRKEGFMRVLKFIVSGQQLKKDETCDFNGIVSDTKGYLHAEFTFSEEWDGLEKAASFYCRGEEHAVKLENGVCEIPEDALEGASFDVGVVGANEEIFLTTSQVTVNQRKKSSHIKAKRLLIGDEKPEEQLEKLKTPTIYIEIEDVKPPDEEPDEGEEIVKLATPTIYIDSDNETSTTAILGKAILGYAVLGNSGNDNTKKLSTPTIYLREIAEGDVSKLTAPTIRLESLEELEQLDKPVIYLETEEEKNILNTPVITLVTLGLEKPEIYLEESEEN